MGFWAVFVYAAGLVLAAVLACASLASLLAGVLGLARAVSAWITSTRGKG